MRICSSALIREPLIHFPLATSRLAARSVSFTLVLVLWHNFIKNFIPRASASICSVRAYRCRYQHIGSLPLWNHSSVSLKFLCLLNRETGENESRVRFCIRIASDSAFPPASLGFQADSSSPRLFAPTHRPPNPSASPILKSYVNFPASGPLHTVLRWSVYFRQFLRRPEKGLLSAESFHE